MGLVVKRNIVFITLYIGNIFQGNKLTEINGKRKMKILKLVFFAGCTINSIHIVFGWYFVPYTVRSSVWNKHTKPSLYTYPPFVMAKLFIYGKDMSLVHYTIR